jgi:hypothetical protein
LILVVTSGLYQIRDGEKLHDVGRNFLQILFGAAGVILGGVIIGAVFVIAAIIIGGLIGLDG